MLKYEMTDGLWVVGFAVGIIIMIHGDTWQRLLIYAFGMIITMLELASVRFQNAKLSKKKNKKSK